MCSGALARTSNEPVMGIFRRDWGIEPKAPPKRAAAPSRICEFTHPALRSSYLNHRAMSGSGGEMERTATCACGQLRLRCVGDPILVSLCHCLACQKRTGSSYGIAAFFARDQVRASGRSRRYTRPSDSGFNVSFRFCPNCGLTVPWEPSRKSEIIAVAVGAYADPAFPPPSQAVYEEHRHPWVGITT